MLDESTNATNWSEKYVAIDRVYRGTDNRNRLIYSDRRFSWVVSYIGHCCFNGNCWHIFGACSGSFGSVAITIAVSGNERSIRTIGTWGHDIVFRCAASDAWVFYRFYRVFIAD